MVVRTLLFSMVWTAGACSFDPPADVDIDAGPTPVDAAVDASDAPGSIDVSWNLVSDGVPAGCPAGATTAAVNAQRSGMGAPYVDLFDCADGVGVATDLPLDTYTVWVDFTDDTGNVTYAESQRQEITLSTPGQVATAQFTVDVDHGFFDVQWQIAGGGCASVPGENGVSVLATHTSTSMGYDSAFDCETGERGIVTTGALPLGDYVVVLSILDAQDASLGDSPPIQDSIDWGNQRKLLNDGPIVITPN
jgi:hypothetical protein